MGKCDALLYLRDMGLDTFTTYLVDILAIIAARKANEKAKVANVDMFIVSESTTPKLEAQIS